MKCSLSLCKMAKMYIFLFIQPPKCVCDSSAFPQLYNTVIFQQKWTIKWIFASLCVPLCSWWLGEWQKCSASCGNSGQTKRTVLCIRAVSADEQKALQPGECEHMPKPESVSSCNTHVPCPADWSPGSWSKVSLSWKMRSWFGGNCADLKGN